jgi:hypothetical protein
MQHGGAHMGEVESTNISHMREFQIFFKVNVAMEN